MYFLTLSIFGNKFLVFKDRMLENREFQDKRDRTCISRRKIKFDVWKYICPWGYAQFWRKGWIARTVHFADIWQRHPVTAPCKQFVFDTHEASEHRFGIA